MVLVKLPAGGEIDHVDADCVAEAGGIDQRLQPGRDRRGRLGVEARMAHERQARDDDEREGKSSAHLRTIACFALVLLALSCGGDPAPRSDAITLVVPRDAEELDPRFISDPYGIKVSRLVFASLVAIDAQTLEPVNDLAESIESSDATRYRVTLRDGVVFSDGSPLDADDVVATYRSVLDPAIHSRYASTYRRIQEVHADSPRVVTFQLDAPHATFVTDLEMPILRGEDCGAAMPHDALPIGAGPYRLVRREPGHLRLEANQRWYRGTPLHRAIEIAVVRDDNTRALRVLAGKADLALSAVPPLLLPMFEEDARFRVTSAAGAGTTYLGFHTESPVLADVRVRRAIAHAIDREALIRAKLGGRGTLASSWVPDGHWSQATDLPTYDYDLARARGLLAEAGVRGAHLTLRTSSDRGRVSISRALAAMLEAIGFEVDVRPSETASMIADLNRGRFELVLLQLPELFEPHLLAWFFSSERIPGGGNEGANRWRFRSPELDAALERGRTTTDRAARRAAYVEAQRILARDLPVVPLWHDDVVAVTGPRLRDYEVPRDGRFGTLALRSGR